MEEQKMKVVETLAGEGVSKGGNPLVLAARITWAVHLQAARSTLG
jgi:hypothetical protein